LHLYDLDDGTREVRNEGIIKTKYLPPMSKHLKPEGGSNDV